jgi:multidrug resistance protein, MATE family
MSAPVFNSVDERKTLFTHTGTTLVGQFAGMGFAVADSIIAGRYSSEALASFSVGMALYASVFVALMGVIQGLLPIYAEHLGARRHAEVGRAWQQTMYLCLGLAAFGALILLTPAWMLRLAQVPQALQLSILGYLQIQAVAIVFALLFRSFAVLSQALGLPRYVTLIQVLALPIKVALSSWFVFGGYGLAPMGVVGCAWATLLTFLLMVALAFVLMLTQAAYQPFGLMRQWVGVHWPAIRAQLRLGLPSGAALLFEVTSFTLMAVLIARLGVAASAAHQIAVNAAAVIFMVPLSLAIAVSARTSFWIGAGDMRAARATVKRGFKWLAALGVLLAVALVALRQGVAAIYSGDPQVLALGTVLLLAVALYQLGDGVQTLAVFVLRSYRVTIAPFFVYAVVLWGLGLGLGMVLTYQGIAAWGILAWQSPLGFWVAAAAAVCITALVFVAMLVWVMRQPQWSARSSAPGLQASAG